jgi:hypothetical protein
MLNELKHNVLIWSTVALLAAGVLWSGLNFRRSAAYRTRLERKMQDIEILRGYQAGLQRDRAALEEFASLPGREAAALDALLREAAPGAGAEVRQPETRSLLEGWIARRADVTFSEVALADAAGFMRAAEAQRPPWRVQECAIAASQQGAGIGRVTLVLQSLTRESVNR